MARKYHFFNPSLFVGLVIGVVFTLLVVGTHNDAASDANAMRSSIQLAGKNPTALPVSASNSKQKPAPIHRRKPEISVIEVGSYTGEEIVQFRGRVKKFITYEPHPGKIPKINQTVFGEGMADVVTIRHAAVTNFSGSVTLYLPNGPESQQDSLGKMSFTGGEAQTVEVPAVMLDDEIHEHVDFLKIDTQGHEWQVLLGARKLIENYGVDYIHAEFSPQLMRSNGIAEPWKMLEWLNDVGYVCFYCTEPFTTGTLPDWKVDPTWEFQNFTEKFGPFYYGGVDHGMWGDIICL